MSDDAVGAYINEHFLSSYQKVGTFIIANGQKQGGNVATYFCLADGTVLNAVAGPLDAREFLREARWVVETRKAAITETREDAIKYAAYFRKAHAERFFEEYASKQGGVYDVKSWEARSQRQVTKLYPQRPANMPAQTQVQWLLAAKSSPKVSDIYKIVYQDILGERISNLPVIER